MCTIGRQKLLRINWEQYGLVGTLTSTASFRRTRSHFPLLEFKQCAIFRQNCKLVMQSGVRCSFFALLAWGDTASLHSQNTQITTLCFIWVFIHFIKRLLALPARLWINSFLYACSFVSDSDSHLKTASGSQSNWSRKNPWGGLDLGCATRIQSQQWPHTYT